MNPIKTLLVDDEYLALHLLGEFLRQIPGIEVVAQVTSPMKALEILQAEPVQLLFLDIQMPLLSGNNSLKTLKNPPLTIFTTAYDQYAVEAFDLQAVDYLLKPFSFERLLKAVNRAKEFLAQEELQGEPREEAKTPVPEARFMSVRSNGKLIKIFFEELLFIEGLGEYVKFHCVSQKIVALMSLKTLEESLPAGRFLRVHKSFIVAADRVTAVEGNQLLLGADKIPVSREKRDQVLSQIFGKEP
ncbi:MAG: response regulator transcription factor [Haliscomenobacter sp.]|nr:response regulator transcription factor [Haliscomenobacter sp.]